MLPSFIGRFFTRRATQRRVKNVVKVAFVAGALYFTYTLYKNK